MTVTSSKINDRLDEDADSQVWRGYHILEALVSTTYVLLESETTLEAGVGIILTVLGCSSCYNNLP